MDLTANDKWEVIRPKGKHFVMYPYKGKGRWREAFPRPSAVSCHPDVKFELGHPTDTADRQTY